MHEHCLAVSLPLTRLIPFLLLQRTVTTEDAGFLVVFKILKTCGTQWRPGSADTIGSLIARTSGAEKLTSFFQSNSLEYNDAYLNSCHARWPSRLAGPRSLQRDEAAELISGDAFAHAVNFHGADGTGEGDFGVVEGFGFDGRD